MSTMTKMARGMRKKPKKSKKKAGYKMKKKSSHNRGY